MIRTALRHHAPTEVAEAVAFLDTHAERAAVLAGGTMLVPSLTRGERDLDHVIDLRRLGFDAATVTADSVHIGAMVTYAHLLVSSAFPGTAQLLQRVAGGITGGPQIRCQGTICGSAAYANPSSEVPAVLVALDATMYLHGPGGARITPAAAFFLDAYTVDLRRGELLTGVSVAARAARLGYYKLKLAEGSCPSLPPRPSCRPLMRGPPALGTAAQWSRSARSAPDRSSLTWPRCSTTTAGSRATPTSTTGWPRRSANPGMTSWPRATTAAWWPVLRYAEPCAEPMRRTDDRSGERTTAHRSRSGTGLVDDGERPGLPSPVLKIDTCWSRCSASSFGSRAPTPDA